MRLPLPKSAGYTIAMWGEPLDVRKCTPIGFRDAQIMLHNQSLHTDRNWRLDLSVKSTLLAANSGG